MSDGDWDLLPEPIVAPAAEALPIASPPIERSPLVRRREGEAVAGGPVDEAAVVALQQRLEAAAVPKDAVSLALRRRSRKDLAAHRLGRELAAREVPNEPAAPVSDPDHDAREQEPWFHSLPDCERARLHAVWHLRSAKLDQFFVAVRRDRRVRFVSAVIVFGAIAMVQWGMLGGYAALLTVAAGMVAGLCWSVRPLDRFWCSATAVFGYFGVQAAAVVVNGSFDFRVMPIHFMFASVLCWLSATVAMDAEVRQTGGFGSV